MNLTPCDRLHKSKQDEAIGNPEGNDKPERYTTPEDKRASITVSATFGYSASPDNVTMALQ